MKKIRNIQQLKAETKRLEQRRAELEKAIRYDWRDVKDSLRPRKLAGDAFSSFFADSERKNGHSVFSEGIAELVSTFARNMAEKAAEKFGKWYKK